MDQRTKQWIVDRLMWTLGLVVAVLVATQAIAGAPERIVATDRTWSTESRW
jgi:hypothetical protein